jgi:hypothetical protein
MVLDLTSDPSGPSRDPTIPPLLFLVVLGGRVPGVHIELHDVRFVVGHTLEDTLPALRRQWFGPRRGLHIDSWLTVKQVDRFAVHLSREPWEGTDRLWFVNLGGYRPEHLAEEHAFGLVVSATVSAAKRQAMATWLPGAVERHKDDVHPVACLEGWHVHLRPVDAAPPPLVPDWFGYRPI